jgi:hypothetical protein
MFQFLFPNNSNEKDLASNRGERGWLPGLFKVAVGHSETHKKFCVVRLLSGSAFFSPKAFPNIGCKR